MIQIRLDLQKITWPPREPPRPIITFLYYLFIYNLSQHNHKLICQIFPSLVEVFRALYMCILNIKGAWGGRINHFRKKCDNFQTPYAIFKIVVALYHIRFFHSAVDTIVTNGDPTYFPRKWKCFEPYICFLNIKIAFWATFTTFARIAKAITSKRLLIFKILTHLVTFTPHEI